MRQMFSLDRLDRAPNMRSVLELAVFICRLALSASLIPPSTDRPQPRKDEGALAELSAERAKLRSAITRLSQLETSATVSGTEQAYRERDAAKMARCFHKELTAAQAAQARAQTDATRARNLVLNYSVELAGVLFPDEKLFPQPLPWFATASTTRKAKIRAVRDRTHQLEFPGDPKSDDYGLEERPKPFKRRPRADYMAPTLASSAPPTSTDSTTMPPSTKTSPATKPDRKSVAPTVVIRPAKVTPTKTAKAISPASLSGFQRKKQSIERLIDNVEVQHPEELAELSLDLIERMTMALNCVEIESFTTEWRYDLYQETWTDSSYDDPDEDGP
ncbi:MAG: hypothetical protein M1826_002886 [Phylliscum demangeonii]|nr:MAG: hypothetical protein M1826_002886 [Phylliscum demangeonii]